MQQYRHNGHEPMETSLIFSLSRNSSATETFSSCICRNVGRWLYFRNIFFWLRTSRRPMSRSPSLRSVCRLAMRLLTHFRCSLHQRVKVFCWIFFHGASSARSFSVAGMSTSLSEPRTELETGLEAAALDWWRRGCGLLIFIDSALSLVRCLAFWVGSVDL